MSNVDSPYKLRASYIGHVMPMGHHGDHPKPGFCYLLKGFGVSVSQQNISVIDQLVFGSFELIKGGNLSPSPLQSQRALVKIGIVTFLFAWSTVHCRPLVEVIMIPYIPWTFHIPLNYLKRQKLTDNVPF